MSSSEEGVFPVNGVGVKKFGMSFDNAGKAGGRTVPEQKLCSVLAPMRSPDAPEKKTRFCRIGEQGKAHENPKAKKAIFNEIFYFCL